MNKQAGLAVIVALVVGIGIGYVIPHAASAARGSFAAGGGQFRGGAGSFGGRTGGAGPNAGGFLSGTIAKEDSESITLNMRDGSSRVVLITPATTVSKSINGSMNDLTVGSDVIVNGSVNSDGSVSASLIQLRPANLLPPTGTGTPATQ